MTLVIIKSKWPLDGPMTGTWDPRTENILSAQIASKNDNFLKDA